MGYNASATQYSPHVVWAVAELATPPTKVGGYTERGGRCNACLAGTCVG